MRSNEIKQIEFDINNGSPDLRLRFAEEAIPVLRQDLNRLRDAAASQCEEFKATFEAWTSRTAGDLTRPLAVGRDLRDAMLVKLVAWLLTFTELALSFFMALVFLVNPFFVLMLALVAIFSLKAGLLAIWRDDTQPQLTRRKLRRWVIIPSLVVTLLAVVMLIFTRGVLGWLALLLLPFINWMLCALSLGVLGLAAGLFALGYLLSWSRHAERRFNRIEREAVETRRMLQKVEKIAEELRATRRNALAHSSQGAPVPHTSAALQNQVVQTPLRVNEDRKRANHTGSFLTSLVFMFAILSALLGSGCKLTDEIKLGVSARNNTADSQPGTHLEIWLDWSLSAEAQAYRETAGDLVTALPDLVMKHHVERVMAYRFGDKGWNAPEILGLDLPRPQTVELGEVAPIYSGVANEQSKQADRQFQAQLREKLSAITIDKLAPSHLPEPPCTDLRGVLARIADTQRPQRRLVFLLTDGHDTCSKKFHTVSLTRMALVIVILPEEQRAGASERPDDLWKHRREELSQAVPSAVIIPYFNDLKGAAGEAMSKGTNQKVGGK